MGRVGFVGVGCVVAASSGLSRFGARDVVRGRTGRYDRAGLGTLTSSVVVSSGACPVAGPLTGRAGDDPH